MKSFEKDWPNKHHVNGYVYLGCYGKGISKLFFFFQGKAKWFSCEFSREKKMVFVWICEVKRVLENWMKKVYKLLEKKTRNYRGFKDTTEAMEKA